MFNTLLASSLGNAGKEGRGCFVLVMILLMCGSYSARIFFASLLPNFTIIYNAKDYKPAKFVVTGTSYCAQTPKTPATWMAMGKVDGRAERLDLQRDTPDPGSSATLTSHYPNGKVLGVMINEKFSAKDVTEWPDRIVLGDRRTLEAHRSDFWNAVVHFSVPWIALFALSILFAPRKLTPG